jgi:hypothetical protein
MARDGCSAAQETAEKRMRRGGKSGGEDGDRGPGKRRRTRRMS